MRSHSTFIKLFLDNLLVVGIVICLAGAVTYQQLDANYQQESRQNQEQLLHIAAEHFQSIWPADSAKVNSVCRELLHDPSMRFTVVAADGSVLGDSQADPHTMTNHRTEDRPEILAALDGKSGANERRSGTVGIRFRYIALPLTHNGQVVAAVRLAMPIKAIAEGEVFLRNTILLSAVVGVVAAVLLGLLSSWMWYSPLRRITQTARQIASGDLSSKAGITGSGRLAELAMALNETRDNLGKYLAQIACQHQDFQTVLASLQEGVIATDSEGRVVLMNQAAGDLLSTQPGQAVGQSLTAIIISLDILEFQERAMASGTLIRGQFELDTPRGRRILEVHATRVPPGPSNIRSLLVMRDITDLATAAAMKAQFVANASHELRTPLATIRAAVDSLAAVDVGNWQEITKLSSVLNRHVSRLENMTNDLLDLHMVESAKFALRPQDIALSELAHWAEGQFSTPAQNKGLHLEVSSNSPNHTVHTDRKLLELILRNLLDNAVKFTSSGGHVRCTLDADPAGAIFRVSDTGCGIRSEDQPRVFERFFQSDSSRTGDSKIRGTGLGLAIVKHAGERLGAKVELQSDIGRGTTISVTVPNIRGD